MGRAAIEGWLSLDAATALLKTAGQDFDALKEQAATREFKPVPLGLTASMSFKQTRCARSIRRTSSRSSTGSDPALKNEYVVYTAHWDHFGVGTPVNGDTIYNGALDNASGIAMLLEIARAFKKVQPRAEALDPVPRR